jgi:hypothetical protein
MKLYLQIGEKRLVCRLHSIQPLNPIQGKNRMSDKLFAIEEELQGSQKAALQRVMRMIPDKDKQDKNLQRLLAFRLRVDGEAALSEHLLRKIRKSIECAYTGRLFDFLKDDLMEKECRDPAQDDNSPGVA